MKRVFVCSPFAGDIAGNVRRTIEYCRYEIIQGNAPFAPHLLYPQMLCECDPEQRETGIRLGLEMLKVCDELHVYGDRISAGMAREIAVWREMGQTPMMCSVLVLIRKREMNLT